MNNVKKISYETVYCFCYGICVFAFALKQSHFNSFNSTISILLKLLLLWATCVPLFLYTSSIKKLNLKMIILVSVFFLLLLLNIFLYSASNDLIYIVYFILMCYKCKPQKILKYYTISAFLALALVLLYWKVGLIESMELYGRYYLGFHYTTFAPNFFLHICYGRLAWKKENIRIGEWIIILLINYWLFRMTDTLAVFISVISLFILYYAIKTFDSKNKIIIKKNAEFIISYFSVFAVCFTSIAVVLYCKFEMTSFFIGLDRLLSMRLSLTKHAFENYPITLFGQTIEWITGTSSPTQVGNYFYVDSSYMQILLQYGIVMLTLMCIMFTIIGKYAAKTNDIYLSLAIIAFLIHCITDPQLLSFRYDPFLIILLPAYATLKQVKRNHLVIENTEKNYE